MSSAPALPARQWGTCPAGVGAGGRRGRPGARIPCQRLLDHRGRRLADIDLHQLWGEVGPCLALPRADLHHVLRDGVPVRPGRTVEALEHVDGPVQATFDDGSGGADGLRSSVRRLAVDD